ncbi:hypothetical protein B0W44_07360 [Novibacillus thermophilus]|uniref:IrrE N-terminal-like domain-containing protein n=2 Tax=Novibacillus thermophilus TaxID=1471761 RepID=A0A1U9K6E0_9BACL|nr:hypothetical protein B0W44_07360 [Novibacillus thermophilus]
MIQMYYKTPFEEKIERLFSSKGIINPSELSIEYLSNVFNIQIVYISSTPERAIWDNRMSVIFLDSTKSLPEMREIFFHELAHPILHVGNQLNMCSDFRNYQENQAKIFQLYAAIPFYMIKKLNFPSEDRLIIEQLSDTFIVTHQLAKKRWQQIKQRIYSALYLRNTTTTPISQPRRRSKETQRALDKLYRQTGVRS